MNSYDEIAECYARTADKPDKAYSTLSTVLALAGRLDGKTVLDLGCGDGYFTRPLARQGAATIIGIDRSSKQIALAKATASDNIEYRLADAFTDPLPKADVINCPYILNEIADVSALADFFRRLFVALNPHGTLILVYDKPAGRDHRKFGAVKTVSDFKDGASMRVDLYNRETLICTLNLTYFTEDTIIRLLRDAGFQNIRMHQPIVSDKGKRAMGEAFWNGYVENCELGYLTAEKE